MKFTFFVALASVLVAAQAVTIADRSADSTECFTTHTGYLVEDKDFGINSENLIVWPYNATNPKIKLSLQACPQLSPTYGAYIYPTQYFGRLVAVATSTIPANQCLTATPSPSNANILHGKLQACGSAYVPAADQVWGYTENDFGNEILFAGQTGCSDGTGTIVDSTAGDPVVTKGSSLWQLQCIDQPGGASTFGLSGTWS
ncbi:hypothetical protein FIBSPDRAFT_853529 [Athelia psychrophila]|uniref:Ricin B lectin domain-containing protein n=1 Tax=Athelia psychrophila TaxID=1759441 RepID=A0A166QLG7_9AGAM|nr:hypothetical protein FIBSPDRAFT_853529 [Fibularhizoctonia sp. CBS 109695]